jgi:hypothetical protein
MGEVSAARGLIENAARVQQEQAQRQVAHYEASMSAFRTAEDAAFEAEFAKVPQERQTQIKAEALAMLRESGLSDEAINWNWHNNALLRSRQGQKVLADAAAWRLHQKMAQSMRPVHQVPKVQRPGSPLKGRQRATLISEI